MTDTLIELDTESATLSTEATDELATLDAFGYNDTEAD